MVEGTSTMSDSNGDVEAAGQQIILLGGESSREQRASSSRGRRAAVILAAGLLVAACAALLMVSLRVAAKVVEVNRPPTAISALFTARSLEAERALESACQDDEESHWERCYKNCSLLTNGTYTIRTSPWSCCKEKPCLFNNIFSIKFCDGYDVGGSGRATKCPAPNGVCLENEEYLFGLCYKKCSILTGGNFSTRIAAATCCNQSGLNDIPGFIQCVLPTKSRTKTEFFVGGGPEGESTAEPHKSLVDTVG
jgi:hypothetical protein